MLSGSEASKVSYSSSRDQIFAAAEHDTPGPIVNLVRFLLEPALRVVYERAMRAPREAVRIELAHAGPGVGLVGAGALLYYYHNTGS